MSNTQMRETLRQMLTDWDRLMERVRALRTEAGAAGDGEQVTICDRALAGEPEAVAECASVIAAASAKSGDTIRVGDRVEGGDIPDDRDTGTVLSLDGDMAIVAWDSHIQTPAPVSDMRRI